MSACVVRAAAWFVGGGGMGGEGWGEPRYLDTPFDVAWILVDEVKNKVATTWDDTRHLRGTGH